jgi:hypothetical protein
MKYLIFPIAILKEHPSELKNTLDNAMDYCLYKEYLKDKNLIVGANRLGITFPKPNESYNNGKKIYESISDRAPKTSVKKDLIFEFYKQHKTEFQKVCFLAYCAFRSIIQKQPYTKATNEYLLNRMAGNNSKGGALPQWLTSYANEYQLNKIKTELQLNFGLKYYAYYTRGFWFSFSLNLISLTQIAETKRAKRKEKLLSEQKKEARRIVLEMINEKHD